MRALDLSDGAALARSLRAIAREALPERAFLRRDRGDALFVSDAPRWGAFDVPECFDYEVRDGLLRLWPSPACVAAFAARHPDPPDFFCETLKRFCSQPVEAADLRLFAQGLRFLDGAADAGDFERRLRQRAAVCLRDPARRPGGLYACGLLLHHIKLDPPREEATP